MRSDLETAPGLEGTAGQDAKLTESSRSEAKGQGTESENGKTVLPDYGQALGFLRRFRPDGAWVLTAIDPRRKGTVTATFEPGREEQLRGWLEQHGSTSNIYFTVNRTLRPMSKKPKREDISAMEYLHVDIDPRPREDLQAEQTRALKLLQDFEPKPTCIVFSGGGYQGFWKLREPFPIEGQEAAYEDAKRYNQQLEVLLGADNCSNVDRVMRLPGTVNRPDDKKRSKGRVEALAEVVEFEESRVYDLSQFTPAPAANVSDQRQRDVKVSTGGVRRLGSIDELPPEVPGKLKELIVQGTDLDEPAKWSDRSRLVLHVCCELVRRGVDDATICGVITDPDFGVSAHVREKGGRSPVKYAVRQVDRARQMVAEEDNGFETDPKGTVLPTRGNIRLALTKLGVEVEHDGFSDRDFVRGLEGFGPYLDDKAMNRLRLQVDERFGRRVAKEFFCDVVSDLAMDNRCHPVREYLDGLTWDGTPRIDTWLTAYAGAEDSEYTRAVGALVLVAAVRRVREPGCKFDEMLVLEGPQGRGKSSLLQTLAVREEWFSDDLPLNADTKRQMEALAGRWIVEAGELKGMRKSDVAELKSFLSRRVDRARMAYGRAPTELPRQCVIVGTTNSDKYLKDSTGNRRFWPVRTAELRLGELSRDRDQLWAEAARREAEGAPIRLDPELYAAAGEAQEDRLVCDPFMEILGPLLDGRVGKISTEDVWRVVGLAEPGRRTQDDNNRLGEVTRRLGWEKKRLRTTAGELGYHYVRGSERERAQLLAVDGQPGAWRLVAAAAGRSAKDQYQYDLAERETAF